MTALIVSQALDASGPPWGRIIKCFTGERRSWELPNWEILRPAGERPQPYPAQIFSVQYQHNAAIGRITALAANRGLRVVIVSKEGQR